MNNTQYAFLDIRGLVLKSLYGGKDPDSVLDNDGKKVNTAKYGFSNFMERFFLPVLKTTPSRSVIAVWDGGNKYREGVHDTYKKKRHERVYSAVETEQTDSIMAAVQRLLNYTGCTSCKLDGVEADDLIAYLDGKLPGQHYIWTIDKDLTQLDDETTDVVYGGQFLKIAGDLGDPQYVALEKSLVGDTSDEYPGVKGFGQVKYDAIIEEFGEDSREDLLQAIQHPKDTDLTAVQEALGYAQNPQAIKGLELILDDLAGWKKCYDLAILHPELCEGRWNSKFVKIEWTKRLANASFVHATLKDMNSLEHFAALQDELPTQTLITNDNWDDFVDDFNDQFDATPFLAFDYESCDVLKHEAFNVAKKSGGDYVDVLSQSITGMSVTYGVNMQHTVYISVDHAGTVNVPDDQLLEVLKMAQEGGKSIVAHNAPFEVALTDTNFLHHLDPIVCTRIMSVNVDENDSHRLKDLTKRYLQYQQTSYKQVLESAKADNMQEMSGEQVLSYGCDDSACAASLADLFFIIGACEGTNDFLEYEYDTNSLLYSAFESGMRIDWERLEVMRGEDSRDYLINMEGLRSSLAMNCKDVDPEQAAELYNELSEYEASKMRADDKSNDAVVAKLEVMRTRLNAATKYDPLVTQAREVKFVATPLQITKVARQMGIDADLTGVTASKITEFLVTVDTGIGGQHAARAPDVRKDSFLELLAEASKELKKREGEHYDAFFDLCLSIVNKDAPMDNLGDELNLDSPPQMQQLLYCKMGLPIRLYSKMQPGSTRATLGYRHGGPATDDDAIDAALAEDAPIGDWRREALINLKTAKSCQTRRKNYWEPYPLWKHPRDGCVHGGITNCGTVTRRFTGSNPNFLQLSSTGGVRTMILPRKEGHVILSPDWNSQELRITASLSGDPVMIDAYNGEVKKDLHSITAAAIAGTVLEREAPQLLGQIAWTEVNGLQTMQYEEFLERLHSEDVETAGAFKTTRGYAKMTNFLINYMGSSSTLARNLIIPVEVADRLLKATFTTYARLEPWQQESIEFARTHGYVLSAYGNRRHLGEGLFSDDKGARSRLERQAVNSQIQGSAADIMKVVLSAIHNNKIFEKSGATVLTIPYDEISVSVPQSAAWDLWCEMKELMTLTPPNSVVSQLPELKASALNWGTCAELGADPTERDMNDLFDRQFEERDAA